MRVVVLKSFIIKTRAYAPNGDSEHPVIVDIDDAPSSNGRTHFERLYALGCVTTEELYEAQREAELEAERYKADAQRSAEVEAQRILARYREKAKAKLAKKSKGKGSSESEPESDGSSDSSTGD